MSDHLNAEQALQATIELERMLETLGATSWGLGNRANEMRNVIGERLYEDLRYLAWARNKVAHEDPRYLRDEERRRFETTAEISRRNLEKLTGHDDPDDEPLEPSDILAASQAVVRGLQEAGARGNDIHERIVALQDRLDDQMLSDLELIEARRYEASRKGATALRGRNKQQFEEAAERAARRLRMMKR